MPFKPNYNQQRAERNRLKREKAEAKLREQEQARVRRKMQQDSVPAETPASNPETRDGG